MIFALIPMTIFMTAVFVSLAENETMRTKLSKFFLIYPEGNDPAPAVNAGEASTAKQIDYVKPEED